jgi:signal transduction histidine kinase
MAILRRPDRSRPIRLFLISMFAIPLVSLVGLWVFAVSVTVPEAVSDHNFNVSTAAVDTEGRALAVELPVERADTYLWLLSGRRSSEASLLATRELVTRAIPPAEAALRTEDGLLSAGPQADLNAFFTDLGQLGSIRAAVDSGSLSPAAAFAAYSNVIDAQLHSFEASDQDNKGGTLVGISVGAIQADFAVEMASQEATLVDGALADGGLMSAGVRQLFNTAVTSRRVYLNEATALLTPSLDAGFAAIANSPNYQRFQAMENQITDSTGNGPLPVNAGAWEAVSGEYLTSLQTAGFNVGGQLAAMGASRSSGLVTEAVIAGGVGLAGVIASGFLVLWFGRKVTGDLSRLDGSVRLPRVVERLRLGEDVDVLAESPPPSASSIREISQIASSFATVQAAAFAAAVQQARLRRGISQVFLNISMRNQSLLHRQLGMLDGMERRTTDPAALADLFRLDHLTTRMRRHAEGLIILSGSTPGRGWRDPVPVVDVLRAAVAEVEDYVRVDVVSESPDLVAGFAVNDVIHLVAELVENATVFSPPNTRIEVRADRVGTGLVAEVEDRGLGLSPDEIDDINRRLARPSEFDLVNSEQLGLFVVSTLAVRHQIRVSLRRSAYGGTTAILLLPFGVIVREEEVGLAAADQSGDMRGLPPGTSRPGPEFSADGVHDLSPFGATGRHRLRAAATGRRVHTGENLRVGDGAGPPAPWASPPSPWKYPEPQPQPHLPALPPAPWDVASTSSWPHAFQRDLRRQEAPLTDDQRLDGHRQDDHRQDGHGQDDHGQDDHGQDDHRQDDHRQDGKPPVSMAGSPPEAEAASPTAASHLGMPVRVPQASLAPQLRAGREGGPQASVREAFDVEQRAPETTRNMMMTMQQGWQRGRVDNLDDLDDAPGQGN